MKNLLVVLLIVFSISSCKKQEKKLPEVAAVDTTITKEVSFTELFIDSTALARFQAREQVPDSTALKMKSFYNQRNHQFAWFFPNGLAEFVMTFVNMQNDYISYSGDSSLYNPSLMADVDSLKARTKINPTDSLVRTTELGLTYQFLRYADRAYAGDQQLNTKELSWFIPRRKLDTRAFLDSLVKNKGQNVAAYEPVNRQYNLLKTHLLRYHQLVQTGDTTQLTIDQKTLKKGASSARLIPIKARLAVLGDLPAPDTTDTFDTTLVSAVKQFQKRMGLKADGQINGSFLKELNVPVTQRIRQILINMERIRWMPATPTTDYLLVNIPEFQLHAYENGQLSFDMAVVVGSEAHNTVIFSGTLNQIVFSPYWNIPPGILKNEVLPGIKKNPKYLARHNMEWNNGSVRQKPGKSNSLGLVKFLFPNSYNIYLHDTPSKSLFGESARAFSHGCIRLSDPTKLAEFLLRKDSTWTREKILTAMNSGKEKYVRLRGAAEIPVYIGYFTSWVDRDGKLNFRKDIYGRDQKLGDQLFKTQKPMVALQ